ncbi:MAG: transglycosylase SLT domain-containing protein [Myxococcota bacterium]|nr:transglycosylase SLT domain-containing protein [Myxococcota bacterium]
MDFTKYPQKPGKLSRPMYPQIALIIFFLFPLTGNATTPFTPYQAISYDAMIATRGEEIIAQEARFLAGRTAMERGFYKSGLRYLEGLEEQLPPVKHHILSLRAYGYRNIGDWEKATSIWRELIEGNTPEESVGRAYFSIADSYYANGRTEDAIRGYEIALERYPHHDASNYARITLAILLEKTGDFEKAAAIYQFFVTGNPTHPLSNEALSRLNQLAIEKRIADIPTQTWLERAEKLLKRRSLTLAKETLEKAKLTLVEDDSHREKYVFLTSILDFRQGRFEKAKNGFMQLSESAQSSGDWYKYLQWKARAQYRLGDKSKAVDSYLKAHERFGAQKQGRQALYMAAWLASHSSAGERASQLFTSYLNKFGRHHNTVDARWFQAWNSYKNGELKEAKTLLEDFERRFPKSSLLPRVHYWQGRLFTKLGQSDKAKVAFQKVIEEKPSRYYGFLARQRLSEFDTPMTTTSHFGGPITLAALDSDVTTSNPTSKTRNKFKEAVGHVGLQKNGHSKTLKSLQPNGGSLFNWTDKIGTTIRQLVRFNYPQEAVHMVDLLPPISNISSDQVRLSRLLLYQALGAYNRAHRLVALYFKEQLSQDIRSNNEIYYQLSYPLAYAKTVSHVAEEFSIDSWLILSIMRQESAFKPQAQSWASAQGLMQLIPRTGSEISKRLKLKDFNSGTLQQPTVNIRFGAWYLSELLKKFQGNIALAISAYNAGPVAVEEWANNRIGMETDEFIEEIPYRETRHYVKKVLENLAIYSALYERKSLNIQATIPSKIMDNINF